MPKPDFSIVAQHAARSGYVAIGKDGQLAVSTRTPKTFSDRALPDALKTGNGHIIEKEPQGPGGSAEPVQRELQRVRQLRQAAAAAAMERGWLAMGGPRSLVGLPLGAFQVQEKPGASPLAPPVGYTMSFRGGEIELSGDTSEVKSESHAEISITLVGIECQIRQESEDEIYGVVSVIGPSSATIQIRRFPDSGTLSLGKDGMRITNLNVPLLDRGILQNYTVVACLFENDSGDVDAIAQQVSDKIFSTVAAAVGALTGAPAEAVGNSESFKQNLATGLAWVFGNVLGMGDDAYNAESLGLRWDELDPDRPPALQPAVHRNDDPRAIENWTHKLVLTGRDDGGDVGQYALYFRVGSEMVTRVDKQTVPPASG